MILRLAKSVADTPAISEIAIMTPAIGDAARPMLDANCTPKLRKECNLLEMSVG